MAEQRRTWSQTPENPKEQPALGEGSPPNVDIHRLGEVDNPQAAWEDGGDPSPASAYGANHANRPRKTEIERSQGRKTVDRNRQIVRGQG